MKIGTVPYCNALPLVSELDQSALVKLPPRQLTEALLNGDVDVGLVPSFSILKHDLNAYPEAGLIGCDGAVQSVGFFVRDGISSPSEIKSLYFDAESQTSIELAKIILHRLYGRNLRSIASVTLGNCAAADALLLIGDKALFFREPGYRFWDLGDLWKRMTNTGFMFACWASNRPLSSVELHKLTTAKQRGLKNLSHTVGALPVQRRDVLARYLTQNIVYAYTPSIRQGSELFHAYLQQLGLIGSTHDADTPHFDLDTLACSA